MNVFFAANPLQPLIDLFQWILERFHDIGLGWGMSIVALTLLVRILLLPLTLKQFKSMQSMARHQPELKKLQAKYKNDKDRMNQELMKFYRENKINPLASCLPLLAQIPVFISLFYMLQGDLRREICPDQVAGTKDGEPVTNLAATGSIDPVPCADGGAADFLFIPNLTDKATGMVLITLIVLYVGSQLISTVMSTVSADKTQRYIMYGLPFFFVIFVFSFPAGLLVYWITTNLWTIVQQMIVRRRLGPLRPPRNPDDPPEPSFMEQIRGIGGGGAAAAPAPAGAASPKGRPTGPPPSPPRKKKKRSGRRR